MKKNISRNPLWPDWYNGKKIDEVQEDAEESLEVSGNFPLNVR